MKNLKIKLALMAVSIALIPTAQACDTHFWLVRWAKAHRKNIGDEAVFLKTHPKIAARLDKKCMNARKRKHHENPTPTPRPTPTPTPRPTPSSTPTPTITPVPTPTPTPTPAGPQCVLTALFYRCPEHICTEVDGVQLGNRIYSREEITQIMQDTHIQNGLVVLAKQALGARLNIQCQNSPSQCVDSTLAGVDMIIGNLVVPPIGDGFLPLSSVSNLVAILTDYNFGRSCAHNCDDPPCPEEE
jgi:hypothetical protein